MIILKKTLLSQASFLILFILGSILFLSHKKIVVIRKGDNTMNNTTNTLEQKTCTMTVFVHGAVLPYASPTVLFEYVKQTFRKKKKNEKSIGALQAYIEKIKKHSYYNRQPIDSLGLHKIDLNNNLKKSDMRYIGQQTAKIYKKVFDKANPNNKRELAFYTFNWSGIINHKKRVRAARKLYLALIEESQRLSKEKNLSVKINLIAHSHGSNVALNLAQIDKDINKEIDKENKKNLVINKLIIVGGPVQSETEDYINSKMFEKIYHIYSMGDHVQVLDCVSTKDRFSCRSFGKYKKSPVLLPKNFCQIEIEIGDHKPYHYELWLWARKNFPYLLYRRDFPLYPLPVSVFIPAIIYLVDKINFDNNPKRSCKLLFDQINKKFLVRDKDKEFGLSIPDIDELKRQARRLL